jgi:hypothetical protein
MELSDLTYISSRVSRIPNGLDDQLYIDILLLPNFILSL